MKHLFTLALIVAAFINIGLSQSSIIQNENLFVQEKIGSEFNQFSIQEGPIKILFHNDRIELISDAEGEVSSFFVKLNNVSFGMPEGDGMVNREVQAIDNEAMAKVLGASTVEKSYFRTITYTDAKTGESVLVEMNNNKLEFKGTGDIPMELQLWGNSGKTISRSQTVQLERFGKTIKFSSDNCQVNKNENKISLIKDGGNDNTKLDLSITIL